MSRPGIPVNCSKSRSRWVNGIVRGRGHEASPSGGETVEVLEDLGKGQGAVGVGLVGADDRLGGPEIAKRFSTTVSGRTAADLANCEGSNFVIGRFYSSSCFATSWRRTRAHRQYRAQYCDTRKVELRCRSCAIPVPHSTLLACVRLEDAT
jgi:hypothetical protein